MTTTKKTPIVKDKTNLKTTKKKNKKGETNTIQKQIRSSGKSPNTKNKGKSTLQKYRNVKTTKVEKKQSNIQEGGSDVCSRDLNELLTGNPMVMTGKGKTDFSKEMSNMGQSFSKDVMSSFGGIEDGWDGSPGMPPKFPSGCVLM